MFLFKKKNKKEEAVIKKRIILEELIRELRRKGYSNRQIRKEFRKKNYPDEFIDYLLQLNNERRLKMAKKREDYEDVEEDEELDSDEDEPEDDPDDDPVPPRKQVKPVKSSEPAKDPKVTLTDVLQNHEQRLQHVEAAILRIRNSI